MPSRRSEFELRPGEDCSVLDDAEAQAAARAFRDVLGRFASGITVVTAHDGREPVGLTCQAFSSVSLSPPLVLFVPARTSRAWPVIEQIGSFCVNILAADQEHLAARMAMRGIDKFEGVGWEPSPVTGSPVLDGAIAQVDCTLHAVHEAGDHFVVIGAVRQLILDEDADDRSALLYYRSGYRALEP